MSSFPIDQKRNVIDIENAMLHAVFNPKSQFFGLMGYHVNQARRHIRLRHEELCSHVESHFCSFLSLHIRSITWKTAVTPFIVFSSMPKLPNLC